MKKSLLLGTLATLLFLGAGCAKTETPTGDGAMKKDEPVKMALDTSKPAIKIGWMGPLSGDASSLGQDSQKAAQVALDEVNEAGGINGAKLELIAEDSKCNAKDATSAGNKLINVDKVPVIFGGLCSGETTAVAPTAEKSKVVMISPCSSAPTITTAGDYIFRTYPSDAFQGKVAAEYMFNTMAKKKVAVLAVLGDYGTGLKNAFISRYKELGGEVVFAEDYAQEARDFRTQMTKIKSSGAEAIYFVAYTEAGVAGLKQAKELGVSLPVLGGDAWDDAKVASSGVAEGLVYTVGKTDNSNTSFTDKLKAKGGSNSACAPRSYDNVKIIAEIMNRVGTDATKIKDELYKVKDYPGIGNKITLDKNGDVTTAEYDFKTVKGGKVEVMK